MKNMPIIERFWEKIEPVPFSGCWIWVASLDGKGYGKINIGGVITAAHRFSYTHYIGIIPDGLELDHKCRVRSCVNPDHLEPVTHLENVRRGQVANRTHCPKGHAYDAENTYVYKGKRQCRICVRERNVVYYHAKRRLFLSRIRGAEVPAIEPAACPPRAMRRRKTKSDSGKNNQGP